MADDRSESSSTIEGDVASADLEAASQNWPLAKCLKRIVDLHERRRKKPARRFLASLASRLEEIPKCLSSSRAAVRFVAVSDTHRYQDKVILPAGEVLLFAGDMVGNYGRSHNVEKHFKEFLAWLSVQSKRYSQVFFIAGNHETFLDDRHGDEGSRYDQLRRFLHDTPNCTYLQNEPAQYRGIRLWGSPVTVSRMEKGGKRYYSRAFERTSVQRSALWADVPEGLDLLMTHCPPHGHLCHHDVGDPLLAARLASMLKPPRFHVFGHDHDFPGVESDGRTVFINVAQDECLRVDPHGGGCALLFDIEAR
uniref:Calcineurin-like phosphoesterase domain-containing protein n=1 Tax=Alexandrium catenella TaxID=2925 RepID=A0A7S1WUS2_ALECA|mmetsp:Transcript_93147/g.247426  ORF Transcript_93147/g.247426 Transcript_93147/m.247426 type:complete len:308 (+) Transcript_93147:56-979(+)